MVKHTKQEFVVATNESHFVKGEFSYSWCVTLSIYFAAVYFKVLSY
jgi:hypothetical protein